MECRLEQQSDVEWHAQVYLRLETDSNFREIRDVKETPFGTLITSKEELEKMLRRAQLAILHPSVSSERFVEFDLATYDEKTPPLGAETSLPFSSNVVCVTVWGPEVPDLSFIDLPGEFHSTNEGVSDRDTIVLVRYHSKRKRSWKYRGCQGYGSQTYPRQLFDPSHNRKCSLTP